MYGLLAPASMAQPAADRLAAAAVRAVREKEPLERLSTDAAIAIGGTPAEFSRFIAEVQRRWKRVIARAEIKPD